MPFVFIVIFFMFIEILLLTLFVLLVNMYLVPNFFPWFNYWTHVAFLVTFIINVLYFSLIKTFDDSKLKNRLNLEFGLSKGKKSKLLKKRKSFWA